MHFDLHTKEKIENDFWTTGKFLSHFVLFFGSLMGFIWFIDKQAKSSVPKTDIFKKKKKD